MNDVITEYQKWKRRGEELRDKARLAMESRYRELLLEAIRVAEEYRADFGGVLKPPPAVSAFRYKSGKVKGKRTVPVKTEPPAKVEKIVQPPPVPDRRVSGLQKRLATAKKKLDAAKAAGSPTRNLEDRIYEIEDEIRLAQGAG